MKDKITIKALENVRKAWTRLFMATVEALRIDRLVEWLNGYLEKKTERIPDDYEDSLPDKSLPDKQHIEWLNQRLDDKQGIRNEDNRDNDI